MSISTTLSGQLISIISSPMHLECNKLSDRITKLGHDSPHSEIKVNSETTQHEFNNNACAQVTYFTIPSHLKEALWLKVIPEMMEMSTDQDVNEKGNVWTCVETLSWLFTTVDTRFINFKNITLQISSSSPSNNNANIPKTEQSDKNIFSWLNLEDHIQTANARVLGAVNMEQTLELQILPGEGILWDSSLLEIFDSEKQPKNSAKLLLSGELRK